LKRIFVCIVFCFFSVISKGQNCTASLGNPVVNITFGSGSNTYGPALGPGITNLQYLQGECPNDGYYTIINHDENCWGGNWHTLAGDHTGDPNGYFMLINASVAPDVFYLQTVDGLCEGTTYQFAAWVMNMIVSSGIKPNITFTVEKTDGTVLGTYNTGEIPITNPATWNQYGFYFTTPAGVSKVVIRMKNNSPGGGGNDLALDDITFRPAGPAIKVNFAGTNNSTNTVCESSNDKVTLISAVDKCYVSTAYQWQVSKDNGVTWADVPGATGTNYMTGIPAAGTYLYRLAIAQAGDIGLSECKVISGPLTLIVNPAATANAVITASGNNICAGENVTFSAAPADNNTYTYQWLQNSKPTGDNNPVYSSAALANGDNIACVITYNTACTRPDTSNIITLGVSPNISPSITISASQSTICEGSSITFTAVITNGGASAAFQWLVNGSNAGSGNVFATTSLHDGDEIKCIVTSNYKCLLTPTAESNIIKMAVTSKITPAVTITVDTNNVCTGTPVTFTASVTHVTGAPVYQWAVNGNSAGSNSNIFSSIALQNVDKISCNITTDETCVTANQATSTIIAMQIISKVTPVVSVTSPVSQVCADSIITFSATATNSGTTPNYQWLVNGTLANAGNNTFSTASLKDGDKVQCTVTVSNTCVTTPTAASPVVSVKVLPNLAPVVIIATPVSTICSGGQAVLTATAVNGGTAPAYQWFINGANAGSNNNTFATNSLNNGDEISCMLTSNYTCPAALNALSNKIAVAVNPLVDISVNAIASATNICPGTPVTFTATPSANAVNPMCKWLVNGTLAGTPGLTYTSNNLRNGDVINCSMQGDGACIAVNPVSSNNIAITVYNVPTIAMGDDKVIARGGNIQLSPGITGSIASYLWSPSTGLSNPAVAAPQASPQITTAYTLKVVSTDGCTAEGNIIVKVLITVNIPNAFSPNGDGINDTWNINGLADYPGCVVNVYNRYGQLVYHSEGYTRQWNGTYNNQPLPVATYYYIIDPKNGVKQQAGSVTIIR